MDASRSGRQPKRTPHCIVLVILPFLVPARNSTMAWLVLYNYILPGVFFGQVCKMYFAKRSERAFTVVDSCSRCISIARCYPLRISVARAGFIPVWLFSGEVWTVRKEGFFLHFFQHSSKSCRICPVRNGWHARMPPIALLDLRFALNTHRSGICWPHY